MKKQQKENSLLMSQAKEYQKEMNKAGFKVSVLDTHNAASAMFEAYALHMRLECLPIDLLKRELKFEVKALQIALKRYMSFMKTYTKETAQALQDRADFLCSNLDYMSLVGKGQEQDMLDIIEAVLKGDIEISTPEKEEAKPKPKTRTRKKKEDGE